ncbi:MAG: hypothetical protein HYV13_02505 [Candidatus Doudnabacteria bacterium]|nr:hypothetical protein [Candidatus Doudnabacteria bacterium]
MEAKDLLFADFIKVIEGDLGKTEWVTVFEFLGDHTNIDNGTYFSALIADTKLKDVLERYDWDLRIGGGRPGFMTRYNNGKPTTEYYRYSEKGIEPLVYWRTFSGRKEFLLEISEEFRLYFNLLEKITDANNKTLIYINDDGDEDQAVQISKNKVEIKLKYLKEFLAAKNIHLAIYFEAMRFLDKPLEKLGLRKIDEVKKHDNYTYSLCVRNLALGDRKSQGWLLGKKLIAGLKDFNPTIWETKADEKFEEFIIGVDENGKEITCSCNTDYQSSPGFLTPIFFKREVLKKYYDDPEKYSVEDGYIKREGFWGLQALNNHRDHVVVWLGDLKGMPYKEQTHWRAFNLTPSTRKISHTDYTRNIEGNFADPEHPELYFKYKFGLFQQAWHKQFGWHLFKPLSAGDEHHMKSLHVPTTNGQKEFDDQVASITKIMIDSLNEGELEKGLTITKENARGIDKFEAFSIAHGFSAPKMIEFLRNLQDLRSAGVAHRKGSKYEKIKKFFDIGDKELPVVFEDIIIKCVWVFNTLENRFITEKM